jgi:hypothetical protein
MPLVAFFRDHTPFTPDWNRIRPAGAALIADAVAIRQSKSAATLLRQQVFDLVSAGQQLTVTCPGLSECDGSESLFRELCELLGEAVQDVRGRSGDLGIVIDADCLAPEDAWRIRGEILGVGPLYLKLPTYATPKEFWGQLWRMRSNNMLRLVYSPFVLSQTRLLPDEAATAVIPGVGIQAPQGTSWVTADVDLVRFADEGGTLDLARLDHAVTQAAELCNDVHSTTRWPTAQMRHDAWLNRRLAINITGIGKLLGIRGTDPGEFAALDEMSQLLRRIRHVLFALTRELAVSDGNVPALEQANPGRLVPGGHIGEGWARRWQQALEVAAVRNRNLLAISPWSIFPPEYADPRYANLLPLLRFADACLFGSPPNLAGWKLRDFKNFHRQAAAVLQQRTATHQIAVHA